MQTDKLIDRDREQEVLLQLNKAQFGAQVCTHDVLDAELSWRISGSGIAQYKRSEQQGCTSCHEVTAVCLPGLSTTDLAARM